MGKSRHNGVENSAILPIGVEDLSDESLDLLLDEAERALLDVETRPDQPERRVLGVDGEPGICSLRLAIAELADAFPGVHHDLESIGDRLRNVGAIAAARELEAYPHVMHLVRLSLEVFFRQYPTADTYESDFSMSEDAYDFDRTPSEVYSAHSELVDLLRQRLS